MSIGSAGPWNLSRLTSAFLSLDPSCYLFKILLISTISSKAEALSFSLLNFLSFGLGMISPVAFIYDYAVSVGAPAPATS